MIVKEIKELKGVVKMNNEKLFIEDMICHFLDDEHGGWPLDADYYLVEFKVNEEKLFKLCPWLVIVENEILAHDMPSDKELAEYYKRSRDNARSWYMQLSDLVYKFTKDADHL